MRVEPSLGVFKVELSGFVLRLRGNDNSQAWVDVVAELFYTAECCSPLHMQASSTCADTRFSSKGLGV